MFEILTALTVLIAIMCVQTIFRYRLWQWLSIPAQPDDVGLVPDMSYLNQLPKWAWRWYCRNLSWRRSVSLQRRKSRLVPEGVPLGAPRFQFDKRPDEVIAPYRIKNMNELLVGATPQQS